MSHSDQEARQSLVRTKITEGGRIVLPVSYRRALAVDVGDELLLELKDGELRLFTVDRAIKRAQELVARYVSDDRSLADELIAERHVEAEIEQQRP